MKTTKSNINPTGDPSFASRADAVFSGLGVPSTTAIGPSGGTFWQPSFQKVADQRRENTASAPNDLSDDEEAELEEQRRREVVPGIAMDLAEEDAAYQPSSRTLNSVAADNNNTTQQQQPVLIKPSFAFCRQLDAEYEEDTLDIIARGDEDELPDKRTPIVDVLDESHVVSQLQQHRQQFKQLHKNITTTSTSDGSSDRNRQVPDHAVNPQAWKRYDLDVPLAVGGGVAQLGLTEAPNVPLPSSTTATQQQTYMCTNDDNTDTEVTRQPVEFRPRAPRALKQQQNASTGRTTYTIEEMDVDEGGKTHVNVVGWQPPDIQAEEEEVLEEAMTADGGANTNAEGGSTTSGVSTRKIRKYRVSRGSID